MSISYSEAYHKDYSEASKELLQTIIKSISFIFLAHSGAIIAILGYIKGEKDSQLLSDTFWSGTWFVAGIVLLFVVLLLIYFQLSRNANLLNRRFNFHKAEEEYHKRRSEYINNKKVIDYSKEDLKIEHDNLDISYKYLVDTRKLLSKVNIDKFYKAQYFFRIISIISIMASILAFPIGAYKFMLSLKDHSSRTEIMQEEMTQLKSQRAPSTSYTDISHGTVIKKETK